MSMFIKLLCIFHWLLLLIGINHGYSACDETDITLILDTDIIRHNDDYDLIYELVNKIVHYGCSEYSGFSIYIYGHYVPKSMTDYNIISLQDTVDITSRDVLDDYMSPILIEKFNLIRNSDRSELKSIPLSMIFNQAKSQLKPLRNHGRAIQTNINGLGEHDDDDKYLIFNYNHNDNFTASEVNFICNTFKRENTEHSDVHYILWESDDLSDVTCEYNIESIISLANLTDSNDGNFRTDYLEMIFGITCPAHVDASKEYGEGAFMELGNHDQFIDKNTIIDCILIDNDNNPYTPDLTNDSYLLIKDFINDDNTFQIGDILLITEAELDKLVKDTPQCCNLPPMTIRRIDDDNSNNNDASYIQRKIYIEIPQNPTEYINQINADGALDYSPGHKPDEKCGNSGEPEEDLEDQRDSSETEEELKETLKEIAVKECQEINDTAVSEQFPDATAEDVANATEILHTVNNTDELMLLVELDVDADDDLDDSDDGLVDSNDRRRLFFKKVWKRIKRRVKRTVKRIVKRVTQWLCPICKGNIRYTKSLLGGGKRYRRTGTYTKSSGGLTTRAEYDMTFAIDISFYFRFKWFLTWGGYIDIKFGITGYVDLSAYMEIDIEFAYEQKRDLLIRDRTFIPRISGIAVITRPFYIFEAKFSTLPVKIYAGVGCRYRREFRIGYYIKTNSGFRNFRHGKDLWWRTTRKYCWKTFELSNGDGSDAAIRNCNPMQLGFDLDITPIIGVALWEVAAAWVSLNINIPFRITMPEKNTRVCNYNYYNCDRYPLQVSFKINPIYLTMYFGYVEKFPRSAGGFINLFKRMLKGRSGRKIHINRNNERRFRRELLLGVIPLGCVSMNRLFPQFVMNVFEDHCCANKQNIQPLLPDNNIYSEPDGFNRYPMYDDEYNYYPKKPIEVVTPHQYEYLSQHKLFWYLIGLMMIINCICLIYYIGDKQNKRKKQNNKYKTISMVDSSSEYEHEKIAINAYKDDH